MLINACISALILIPRLAAFPLPSSSGNDAGMAVLAGLGPPGCPAQCQAFMPTKGTDVPKLVMGKKRLSSSLNLAPNCLDDLGKSSCIPGTQFPLLVGGHKGFK